MTNSAFKSLLTFLCSSIQLIHCSSSALSPAAHPASLPLAETVGPRSDWSTGDDVLRVVRGGWERERWRESCHQVGVMELCVVTRQLSPSLYSHQSNPHTSPDNPSQSQYFSHPDLRKTKYRENQNSVSSYSGLYIRTILL